MSQVTPNQPQRIRMVFDLARDDHPRLFDDLIRFQKGTKRINRLRVLAYDGLLVEAGHISLKSGVGVGALPRDETNATGPPVFGEMFGPGVEE
jgi:hypothetical protein